MLQAFAERFQKDHTLTTEKLIQLATTYMTSNSYLTETQLNEIAHLLGFEYQWFQDEDTLVIVVQRIEPGD